MADLSDAKIHASKIVPISDTLRIVIVEYAIKDEGYSLAVCSQAKQTNAIDEEYWVDEHTLNTERERRSSRYDVLYDYFARNEIDKERANHGIR